MLSHDNKNAPGRIPHAENWPREDQDELAEYAREIEARHNDLYQLTTDEREAIERGLAEMREGKLASDDAVAAVFNRYRA